MGEENSRGPLSAGRALAACAIAPYLTWMLLMTALPASAWAYAVRTAATCLAFAVSACLWAKTSPSSKPSRLRGLSLAGIAMGLFVGVAVWALWVFPEKSDFYCRWFILGDVSANADGSRSPYDPAVCGWALTIVRLCGSAFVIAAAEELFFRGFLYRWIARRDWLDAEATRFDWQAFLWTTGLFALEHNRWLAGVMAGAAYALLAIRCGLLPAIVAHSVTNLILGLQVVLTGNWAFW